MPQLTHAARFTAICSLFLAASVLTQAQAPAAPKPAVGTPIAPAEVYGKLLDTMEKEFVSAADAMPEDKYNFAPTQGDYKGVRTFAEEVKHVIQANGYFFHDPTKPLVDDRAEIANLKTKAEIMQALRNSFTQAHAFINSITPENAFAATAAGNTRAGQAAFGLAHFMDHYGQMVEYLRMNGIVPPASR